jgi:glutathione S-transferase
MTECEPHAIEIMYNRVGKPPEERSEAKARECVASLRAPFAVLDQALANSGYAVGGRFTVADINLAEVFRYAQPAPDLFEAAPNVEGWIARCQGRPAFKAMMAMRDAEPA